MKNLANHQFSGAKPCGRLAARQVLSQHELVGHRRATIASAPMHSNNPLNRQAPLTLSRPSRQELPGRLPVEQFPQIHSFGPRYGP